MQIIPLREDVLFPIEATLNKFFDDFFNNKHSILNSTKANSGYPKMNYSSDGKYIRMVFAVPGVNKDDLEVEYNEDNTITIRGKMSLEYQSPEGSQYYVRELRSSSFSRTVVLPDINKPPNASLKDGLLTLTWEIEEAKPKAKTLIEIK